MIKLNLMSKINYHDLKWKYKINEQASNNTIEVDSE